MSGVEQRDVLDILRAQQEKEIIKRNGVVCIITNRALAHISDGLASA
ncbi:MAG: hypothetical protein HQL86_05155 [Magnetococcales bacterium]|nr:hypothetical protein [Magnetococcales bacterium]